MFNTSVVILTATVVATCTFSGCESSSRGAKVFSSNRCPQCHTINGRGGKGGPDLSAVGGRRSREYILQQIKDSKINNPDTNMPSFKDLQEQDLNALADYLARLK